MYLIRAAQMKIKALYYFNHIMFSCW